MLRRMLIALLAAAAGTLVLGAMPAMGALSDVETPTVFGPQPTVGGSHPFLATDADLSSYGYVEEEFEYAGNAFGYDTSGAIDADGTKITTGGALNDGKFPYRTRMIVRRPTDNANFNGTVVVEWLNVTAGFELEANWYGDPEYLLKNGYAWVGISAQRVGVDFLKGWDGPRYGDLDVTAGGSVSPSDALSYEIFSAGVKALLDGAAGADPLGPLAAPETVLASGESQSGSRLSTYYNKIEPLHEIIDGFLLTVSNGPVRDDRPEKVVRVISETENRVQRTEPDDASYRHWEVAAASHLPRMAFDNWQVPITRDIGILDVECEKFPLSQVQWPYVVNSAIEHLVTWTDGGAAPPIAPRGEYVDPSTLAVDDLGLAKGAIRLPEVTVPARLNSGSNAPSPGGPPLSVFCFLLGSSADFSEQLLLDLYADWGDYIDQVRPAAQKVANDGFILQQDVLRLIEQHRQIPTLRPTVPERRGGTAQTRGKFTLNWRGTTAPDTSFRLEHSGDGGSTWNAVKGARALTESLFKFRGEGKAEADGTWIYRVRSATVIPENVVEAEHVVETAFSESWTETTVDRTKPKLKLRCKRKVVVGSRVFIRVSAKDRGVGLRRDPSGTIRVKTKRPGVRKIKVKAVDKVGNARTKRCRVRVVR